MFLVCIHDQCQGDVTCVDKCARTFHDHPEMSIDHDPFTESCRLIDEYTTPWWPQPRAFSTSSSGSSGHTHKLGSDIRLFAAAAAASWQIMGSDTMMVTALRCPL